MVQRGKCLRLALEAGQPIGILGKQLWQHLQRNFTLQRGVVRAVHLAHTARANQSAYSVCTKPSTGREGHDVAGLYRDYCSWQLRQISNRPAI